MLSSVNLNDKSYEELLSEAITQIPLYSKEWTNFNLSDPGITMLQNLTAFNFLQQTRINEVTDEIRRAMLRLLGCEAQENQSARLLLQAPGGEQHLPAQLRLYAGSLCFETREETTLAPWSLQAVYTLSEEGARDITYLMDPRVGSAAVFGAKPQTDANLCLILDQAPALGTPIHLWVQVSDEERRNPFPAQDGPLFAETRWQYFTESGWEDAVAEDETAAFLRSGEIRLLLTAGEPTYFEELPVHGFALRCILVQADYDLPPRLTSLAANLFPVEQRETRACSYVFAGQDEIAIYSALAALGYLFVYCREREGENYRFYRPYMGVGTQGRYYDLEQSIDGVVLRFDSERYGYGPEPGGESAIRVVCYDADLVHHRDLGPVYGYEEQLITLRVSGLLPEPFCLLAELPRDDGEAEYQFVSPNGDDPEHLCYRVFCTEGIVNILHPGIGMEYRLYLSDCVVTQGSTGNLRVGSRLCEGALDGVLANPRCFDNPAPARGGVTRESAEELRRRFANELRTPNTAVLASDYEALARTTPGLCIHKVKALINAEENLVKVLVKSYTEERLPRLSDEYRRQIQAHLDARRMLTTRIEVREPRYVPIHVSAVIYLRNGYQHAQGEVRTLLQTYLDHVQGEAGFGGYLRFHELYQLLMNLPAVSAVDGLRLAPGGTEGAALLGTDILLEDDCLSYPGNLRLEFHDYLDLTKR